VNGVVNRRLRLGSIDEKPMGLWWTGAMAFQFFSAMYGGYFGAGNGILMLAAMGVLGINELHRANGIKNFLGICINAVAVLIFALAGLRRLGRCTVDGLRRAYRRLFGRKHGDARWPEVGAQRHSAHRMDNFLRDDLETAPTA
jgi:hypothetical protein